MSARLRRLHLERTATDLARRSLRGAGTLERVGRRLPDARAKATVGSYVTRSAHPALLPFFRVLVGLDPWSYAAVMDGLRVFRGLNAAEDVTARAMAEAFLEAVEIRELVDAEPERLIERGRWLLAKRHEWNARECAAGESGSPDFDDALAQESFGQIELLAIRRTLHAVHGVELSAGGVR